jgi:predicted RNase H-like HicB family nuclease
MKAIVEKSTNGYSAYMHFKDNMLVATGDTKTELIESMNNAIDLLCETLDEHEAKELKTANIEY